MNALSNYWNIWCISLANDKRRYQRQAVPPARDFLQTQALGTLTEAAASTQNTAVLLLEQFRADKDNIAPRDRAQAGLCLRCYVSEPILRACQKIASQFSGDKAFSYQDLLPFVLHDEGKSLVVLGDDGKAQLVLDDSSNAQPTVFKVFAVEILRTYKSHDRSSMSLGNWAFLQTKQHPELKTFLAEFGFQHLSDWALLNRARPTQLEQLSEQDRALVEVFHQVYRRDRRQQQQVTRCADPNQSQLVEMAELLQQQGLALKAPELTKALKQVAMQLRQLDIWQSRESLEVPDLETGSYELRRDLPTTDSLNELEVEEQEFLEFLRQEISLGLAQAIEQAVQSQIAKLAKSRKYAPFAGHLIPGLRLYYNKGLSLRDIGPQLGMSSWDQTRRILNPGELLSNVRLLMVQQLLDPILEKAQSQGLASSPPEPTYLKTLTEQIEAYLDVEIFEEAASELKAGKNRSLDGVYARQLKQYIQQPN